MQNVFERRCIIVVPEELDFPHFGGENVAKCTEFVFFFKGMKMYFCCFKYYIVFLPNTFF